MRNKLWWLVGVALVAPACGGSTSGESTDGGKTGGGSGTGATGGSNVGGTGNIGPVGGGGSGNVGAVGGGGTGNVGAVGGSGGVGNFGGGGTGNVGGCDPSACGPDGAACCQPGVGCAQSGGGLSCGCGNDYLWHCGGGTGGGGTGGAPGCGPGAACQPGVDCCNGYCANTMNDIFNCGKCGNACGGPHPYCDYGTCSQPPCFGGAPPPGQFCCGNTACNNTDLCCTVEQGPSMGPACYPASAGTCPIGCPTCVCASPDTPIATPAGPRAIASLRPGDRVYSMDAGRLVDVPVHRVGRITAHAHVVVHVELASGATLEISAPHPTADGRSFGDLRVGDLLDGVKILRVERVPYTHDATYDILPESDSGTYFAGGVLIGSTMAAPASVPMCVSAR